MVRDSTVDAWFASKRPLQEPVMQRVRDVILEVDPRIEESIKWQTPTFSFRGNIASFNPAKAFVSVLFHRGGEIPGDHPRLEGSGQLARVMRFGSLDEVDARRADLEAVIRAWIELKGG